LKEKYAQHAIERDVERQTGHGGLADSKTVWISGKQVEEIGYDKISHQQAQLENLRIVILDEMLVSARIENVPNSDSTLGIVLPNIIELDVGRNLFESMDEIVMLCSALPTLKTLTLDGNHLTDGMSSQHQLQGLTNLSLNSIMLLPRELSGILSQFPDLQTLSISGNDLFGDGNDQVSMPTSLLSLVAENNRLQSLQDLETFIPKDNRLQSLSLKYNQISTFQQNETAQIVFPTLQQLDLSGNDINSWQFVNNLAHIAPNLEHLRLSQNPLYTTTNTPHGKSLSESDISLLIIARLPKLKSLNYSTVTGKEKLSGEKLYLSLIGEELSIAPTDQESVIISKHPRYHELCEEYGDPNVQRRNEQNVNPSSLAARLVRCRFHTKPSHRSSSQIADFTLELPKSMNLYAVYGMVGRHLEQSTQRLRLVWESGERDPVAASASNKQGIQEWDSEDEDEGVMVDWAERKIDLIPGTRPLGTLIEKDEATIVVEIED